MPKINRLHSEATASRPVNVTPGDERDLKKALRRGNTAIRLKAEPKSSAALLSPAYVDKTKRKSKRGDAVRARLLQASLECFGAFGFEGTSTRAVAERAGVSHSLLIYHYKSKQELWKETMDAALSRYLPIIRTEGETEGQGDAATLLRQFIDLFVRMSAEVPQIHRILSAQGDQDTERLNWVVENYLRHLFETVRDLIRQGQVDGTVRECDPARLYYHIIGSASTPFTISTEYKAITGRDIFSEAEILRTIAFLYDFVFVP